MEALLAQCARLAREGVDFLQLREKDLPPPEFAEVSRQVLRVVRAANGKTKLFLNSRLDTALLIGTDGVHLSSEPSRIPSIRHEFRAAGFPEAMVSLSCHSLEDVRAAVRFSPDLILFAPIFGKSVGGRLVGAPAGLTTFARACQQARGVPVIALGGVTAENTDECLRAGAAGVAGIRMFMDRVMG